MSAENPHDHDDWTYWVDMVMYPMVFLATALWTFSGVTWLLWAAAGMVSWTMAEYWIHRSVLHTFFWHGTHERHHLHPKEHVAFPIWYTPLGFTGIFVVSYACGLPVAWWAGFVLGYVWFLTMHHLLHHVELTEGTWLQSYAQWHDKHHQGIPCNYGITTNVWDRLFGTSR